MNFSVTTDFISGKEKDAADITAVIDQLLSYANEFVCWPVMRIIEILNGLSEKLLEPGNKLHQKYPNVGIPYIASWCRRSNLEAIIDASITSYKFLDGFTADNIRKDKLYYALPQGLVVHWMAGNVPTLGFISLLQGLLTKNVNLVKVASDSNRLLSDLLKELRDIGNHETYNGEELARAISVIRYDHKETQISEIISKNADVRIIWGSDDSVRAIKRLETKLTTTDIVYPHRTSFILISKDMLGDSELDDLARKAATDISVFEQKACASPHTIFLETTDEALFLSFGEKLKKGLSLALKRIPKLMPSQKEVSTILKLRAKYDMFHEALYSDGTEFTILMDDQFQLGPAVGNRTIFLRKTDNLDRVAELITPQVQSIGMAAKPERFEELTKNLSRRGVIRFTKVGSMTQFEIPWDGYYIPQYLVKWAIRAKLA